MITSRQVITLMIMVFVSLPVLSHAAQMVNLPETGQTGCSNESGRVIPCADTGQDGDIQAGVAWPAPRFTDNKNGTVTDNLTGLIWLKNANCFGQRKWTDALSDANTLSDGQCGLKDGSKAGDWRLPNRKELRSLFDYSKYSPIIPAGHPFTSIRANYYWSSTTSAYIKAYAWRVNMWDGSMKYTSIKGAEFQVWPVRGGQQDSPDPNYPANIRKTGQTGCANESGRVIPCADTGQDGDIQAGVAWPDPRFADNGNGTVTDNLTGLIWLKDANCFGPRRWMNALSDVNALSDGQCGLKDGSKAGDWRLPNVNEFESLLNAGEAYPSRWLNTQGFINMEFFSRYWSSTTDVRVMSFAWYVNMWDGNVISLFKGNYHYVWPVRAGVVLPDHGKRKR